MLHPGVDLSWKEDSVVVCISRDKGFLGICTFRVSRLVSKVDSQ